MKARDIALWGVLDDLHDAIGLHHGVVHQARAPSVAVFHPREIHCITALPFADEDTIAEEYRIAGNIVLRSVVLCSVVQCSWIKAFA